MKKIVISKDFSCYMTQCVCVCTYALRSHTHVFINIFIVHIEATETKFPLLCDIISYVANQPHLFYSAPVIPS